MDTPTVEDARAFCGNGDCACAHNYAAICDDYADPGESAPTPPWHTRCARCGHAKWKHAGS